MNITGKFSVSSLYLKFLDRNAGNSGQGLNPWKDGTILVKRMIEKYAKKLRRIEDVEGLTVFIDTNPAFSVTFFLHIFFLSFQSRQYFWHAPLEKNIDDSIFVSYPNFQAYTELAIAASNRLILPLNAGKISYCEKEKGLAKNCYFCHFYCYCDKDKRSAARIVNAVQCHS